MRCLIFHFYIPDVRAPLVGYFVVLIPWNWNSGVFCAPCFSRKCAPDTAFGDRFVTSSKRLDELAISTMVRLAGELACDVALVLAFIEAVFLLGTGILRPARPQVLCFQGRDCVFTKLTGLLDWLFGGHLSKKSERADKSHVRTLSDFQVRTIPLLATRLLRHHLFQTGSENYNLCRLGCIPATWLKRTCFDMKGNSSLMRNFLWVLFYRRCCLDCIFQALHQALALGRKYRINHLGLGSNNLFKNGSFSIIFSR